MRLDDLRVSARSTETKSDATHGVDEWIGMLTVNLATNTPDIYVNDVGRRVEMEVPDVLQQHSSRHHSALVPDEIP